MILLKMGARLMPKDWMQYRDKGQSSQKKDWMQYKAPEENNIQQTSQEGFITKLPRNITAGLFEAGRGVLNIPHQLKQLTGGHLFKYAPYFEPTNFRQMVGLNEPETLSDKLISGFAQHAPAFLAPEAELGSLGKGLQSIPKVGKYLKKTIGTAIPVGAYEATQSGEEPITGGLEAGAATTPFSMLSQAVSSANPYARGIGRAGLIGLGGYLGHQAGSSLGGGLAGDVGAILGGGLGAVGLNPRLEARRSMLRGVEATPYKENLEAAQRLGLSYLTPAEASKNPFVGAQQGAIGLTEKGAPLLYKRGTERLESEERAINKLLDTTYNPKEFGDKVNNLYETAYKKEMPTGNVDELMNNKIVQRADRMIQNKPAYQESLKDVPRNSIAYLDHLKQAMDDMIEKAPSKEARLITKTKKNLIDKMDEVAPEYKEARALSERKLLRDEIEQAFNKKDMRGTNFYKVLENKNKFNEIMHHMRNVPEAQQQLKDMRQIFGDLINPSTVRTAAGLAKTSMTKERSSLQVAINKAKEVLTGGKYDKAAIDLITNPNWADELHKINQLSSFEKKLSKTLDLLGRASAGGVTELNKK